VLQALVDKSGIVAELERDGGAELAACEGYIPNQSNVLKMLGYFSLIGQLRVRGGGGQGGGDTGRRNYFYEGAGEVRRGGIGDVRATSPTRATSCAQDAGLLQLDRAAQGDGGGGGGRRGAAICALCRSGWLDGR
jgi:hypothetical protein